MRSRLLMSTQFYKRLMFVGRHSVNPVGRIP